MYDKLYDMFIAFYTITNELHNSNAKKHAESKTPSRNKNNTLNENPNEEFWKHKEGNLG